MNDELVRMLEAEYRQLRDEDAARAPSFDSLLAAAREPEAGRGVRARRVRWRAPGPHGRRIRVRRSLRLAALGLTAAVVVIVVGRVSGPGPESASPGFIDLTSVRWTAPTDFLLDVTGSELLRSLPAPELGEWPPAPPAGPRSEPSPHNGRNAS